MHLQISYVYNNTCFLEWNNILAPGLGDLVSISSMFYVQIFCTNAASAVFPCIRNVHVTRKKAAETTFVRKTRTYKVDEIDTLGSFHKCFMQSFQARRTKKHKNTDDLTVFFALLGSLCVKAAHTIQAKPWSFEVENIIKTHIGGIITYHFFSPEQ